MKNPKTMTTEFWCTSQSYTIQLATNKENFKENRKKN